MTDCSGQLGLESVHKNTVASTAHNKKVMVRACTCVMPWQRENACRTCLGGQSGEEGASKRRNTAQRNNPKDSRRNSKIGQIDASDYLLHLWKVSFDATGARRKNCFCPPPPLLSPLPLPPPSLPPLPLPLPPWAAGRLAAAWPPPGLRAGVLFLRIFIFKFF